MMEVELGLIGAVSLMGAAVQLRVLKVLQIKLKEIAIKGVTRHFSHFTVFRTAF